MSFETSDTLFAVVNDADLAQTIRLHARTLVPRLWIFVTRTKGEFRISAANEWGSRLSDDKIECLKAGVAHLIPEEPAVVEGDGAPAPEDREVTGAAQEIEFE